MWSIYPSPPFHRNLVALRSFNILQLFLSAYGDFLKSQGETPVHWRRASSPEEVLKEADVVHLNVPNPVAPFCFCIFQELTLRIWGERHPWVASAHRWSSYSYLMKPHQGIWFFTRTSWHESGPYCKLQENVLCTLTELFGPMWQISLHPILDKTTYHLINKERLALMKKVTHLLAVAIYTSFHRVTLIVMVKHSSSYKWIEQIRPRLVFKSLQR